jgi:hypothetical protein
MDCNDQPSVWKIKQPSGHVVYVKNSIVTETIRRIICLSNVEIVRVSHVMTVWKSNDVVPLYERKTPVVAEM